MVQNDILNLLPMCLKSKDYDIRKEACFTLSNLLLDKTAGHDTVIDNKIMPVILDIMRHDNSEVTKSSLNYFN